jgi:hypothetical protein
VSLLGESSGRPLAPVAHTTVSSGTGFVANIDANKISHACKW